MNTQNVISDIRKKNNLTQDELAEKLFVTRQAVSRWEKGVTTPTIDTLKLISKIFNIDTNTLLGLSDTPICQSCAMAMFNIKVFGTNKDNTVNTEYCKYCFKNGAFVHNRTLDGQLKSNLRFLGEFNKMNGSNYTEQEAAEVLTAHLKTLKRWK
jgi:transcriptional regulator with XRE-family HTH domain